jgi:hypothetical protein
MSLVIMSELLCGIVSTGPTGPGNVGLCERRPEISAGRGEPRIGLGSAYDNLILVF